MLQRRVLVAEENPLMRTWLCAALKRLTPNIDEASSTAELTQLATDATYDLVVCNRSLPDGSGEKALGLLRAQGHSVPFLLLAPFCSERVRAQLARLGHAAVLEDPLDATRIAELGEKLIAGRASRLSARAP
jgi:DNA-binding NarL/FixJ family response regulator